MESLFLRILTQESTIHYAGMTTVVTTPFQLTASIPLNATTAAPGTIVSTDVSASSFAGPMAAFKGSGLVFYSPAVNFNCIEEYLQRDVS
jgi:hypothetical protein